VIKHIKFLGIPVSDQDRSVAFYTEKLGFKMLSDQPFDNKQRWIELKLSGQETGVSLFTPDEHENRIGGFVNTAFACDNIDKTYQELQAKGVECVCGPVKEHWGSYFLIKDPDQNTICISTK
jgi:catechol 2,3-dioxygenase-like lactoylglutathione lyase family enzyme